MANQSSSAPTDKNINLSDVTTNNASTTKHGFTPKYPNDSSKYLDGTGAYSVPPSGSGTVTSVSVATANGFSGTVATATSTPAITIIAGAIVPTSVNGLTVSTTTGTLTLTNAKTLTVSNSLTLAGTDGKGINIGAATSGKILIGDGSNMVLSTSTIPTSAGATANKLLLSDGTNYVLSTPTFPNASATSGKIIKSDGTNWTASTETYAAPGTSGNVLTSDGTNWTSAAAGGSSFTPYAHMSTIYETAGRFQLTTAGSATTDFTGKNAEMLTNSGVTSAVDIQWNVTQTRSVYAGSPVFSMYLLLETKGTDGEAFFGIGEQNIRALTVGNRIDFTLKHIGFKLDWSSSGNASLYATQGAGAAETASSALVSTIAVGAGINICFKVNGTSSVDYYYSVNEAAWSSATNLTTNLPTTGDKYFHALAGNRNVDTGNSYVLMGASYQR